MLSRLGRTLTTNFPSKFPLRSSSSSGLLLLARYSTNNKNLDSLYKRVSSMCTRGKSLVPVLDQWVEEDRTLNQSELRITIKELRNYHHYKHALEISQWMTNRRYMTLVVSDVAIRLDLIGKVHGIEQAESFFKGTTNKFKTVEVYGALLSCYAHNKCVDKAEAMLQQMKDLGFTPSTLNYNRLLSLYFQNADHDKADLLMQEMEAKQIKFDRFTYTVLLNAYGANSDIDALERTLAKIESDPNIDIDCGLYSSTARQLLRARMVDRALDLIKKAEKLVPLANKKNEAFSVILTLYADAGKRNDVLRIWNKCKLYKLSNAIYRRMITSILKFDDIETAEKILMEWESSGVMKDVKIPNLLIQMYCQKGMIEKAEALKDKVITNQWQKPNRLTWSCMSLGYVQSNQMSKAVEALKSAALEIIPEGKWKPDMETVMACVKYLKEEGDIEQTNGFIGLLKEKGYIPVEVYDRLVKYVCGEYGGEDVLEGIRLTEDGETEAKIMHEEE